MVKPVTVAEAVVEVPSTTLLVEFHLVLEPSIKAMLIPGAYHKQIGKAPRWSVRPSSIAMLNMITASAYLGPVLDDDMVSLPFLEILRAWPAPATRNCPKSKVRSSKS